VVPWFSPRPVVPKVCSMDLFRSMTISQGILGYFSEMTALKFSYFLIKGIMFFFFNNCGTSLIYSILFLYDH
jgi:hypothetical protein